MSIINKLKKIFLSVPFIFCLLGYVQVSTAQVTASDSLALVTLYNTTDGINWLSSTNWLSTEVGSWSGVAITGNRVTGLNLSSNFLIGDFPIELGNLTGLESLDLSDNFLTNVVPTELGNLGNLSFLDLGGNQLQGNIPVELGNLLNLTYLNLGRNQFTGAMPLGFTNISGLTVLDISANQLTGTLPDELSALTNLAELNVSQNAFSGLIPASLGELQSLYYLNFGDNQFSGEIPNTFLNLIRLETFFAFKNKLEGNMPDILHLPALREFDVYANSHLYVEVPGDLGTLTGLSVFAIGATKSNGGPFPDGFYQLTNLVRLDVGGQRFTGVLSSSVNNWARLEQLYLWQNELEGDLPNEIASIATLSSVDISQNKFRTIPDFSNSSVFELIVPGNQLSFGSLLPNLGLEVFVFKNQRRIGKDQDINLTTGASTTLSTELPVETNVNYSWIFNTDTVATTPADLTISNFDLSKSGSYSLTATHPSIPDFSIRSGFINLKPDTGVRSWYVDNRPGKIKDFSSLYQAIYATNANDTIYVAGSAEAYDTPGGLLLSTPRVILGPGYFLIDNAENQFNTDPAVVRDDLILNPGADGTKVYGISFDKMVRLNSTFFTEGDTLTDITFVGNRFLANGGFNLIGHIDGLVFRGNFNPAFAFYSTDQAGEGSGLYASYNNLELSNNIALSIKSLNALYSVSAQNNGAVNINLSYNIIDTIANVNDVLFESNIIGLHSATNNQFINNIDYSPALFVNGSGSLSVDSDYMTADPNLPQGAFAGASPYLLSGIPPIPAISGIEIGPRLSARVTSKTANGNIHSLRYSYSQNGQNSNAFKVSGFELSANMEVEFIPNRSSLIADQTYDLVFVAVDESGVRSHRTYIPYTTISASLSGFFTAGDQPINDGDVRLFVVNPFSNKYDTAAVQSLAGDSSFSFQNVILGDYIILADPDTLSYPGILPTYSGNVIDWQAASTILLSGDTAGIEIAGLTRPSDLVEPGSSISGSFEEEFEEGDSKLRTLPRKKMKSSSVSVRSLTASSREVQSKLGLLNSTSELVAIVKTNGNGEFNISKLPAGSYSINFDYPGVPVDSASDVTFSLSGEPEEKVSFFALAENGLITVTEVSRITSNKKEKPLRFKFFPNPAGSKLYLELENSHLQQTLSIMDAKGRIYNKLHIANGQQEVDIAHLPTGLFMLQLIDEKGNFFISRLVKK